MTGLFLSDFPEVVAQLDREAHPLLDPSQIKAGSSKDMFNWLCRVAPDHRWPATVKARCGLQTGCPYCSGNLPSSTSNLQLFFPDIARELDVEKTGKAATALTLFGSEVVWWHCPVGHSYDLRVAHRTKSGQNCPYCSGKRVFPEDSFGARHPRLAAEFHPARNGSKSAFDFTEQSNKRVWWICPTVGPDHDYRARIQHRVLYDTGCSYCSSQRVNHTNSLAALRPDIAAELDAEASGFTADEVTSGSNRLAQWSCSVDPRHRYPAHVVERTHPTSPKTCPMCSNQVPWEEYNLAVLYPNLAVEWHSDNTRPPTEYLPFSGKRVKWRCSRNPEHTFTQTISQRTLSVGCPKCDKGRRFSRTEVRIAHLLAEVFPVDLETRFLETPLGRVEVDIPIPSLSLLVEYDGGYWHTTTEGRDRRKNEKLASAGWTVIRMREHPLERLEPQDVLVMDAHDSPVDAANIAIEAICRHLGLPATRLSRAAGERGLAAAEARIEEFLRAGHRFANTRTKAA